MGRLYSDAPEGLRANMIFSADGAAAIDGRVKGLTCAADQYLLRHLRGYSDAVLVGGATVRAENYGPIRLSADQREERTAAGLQEPRLAIVTLSGVLPESLHSPIDEQSVLLTSRTAAERNGLRDDSSRPVLVAGEDRVEIATALELFTSGRGCPESFARAGRCSSTKSCAPGLLDELCDDRSQAGRPATPQSHRDARHVGTTRLAATSRRGPRRLPISAVFALLMCRGIE